MKLAMTAVFCVKLRGICFFCEVVINKFCQNVSCKTAVIFSKNPDKVFLFIKHTLTRIKRIYFKTFATL